MNAKKGVDAEARAAVEGTTNTTVEPGGSRDKGPKPSDKRPLAGSHADPALTNPDSTPGSGTLTPPGGHDDVDSTSG
jgi:hypothetical protein